MTGVKGVVEVPVDESFGKSWVLEAGYRHMDVDYDEGQGLERKAWSMTYQGPYLVIGKIW